MRAIWVGSAAAVTCSALAFAPAACGGGGGTVSGEHEAGSGASSGSAGGGDGAAPSIDGGGGGALDVVSIPPPVDDADTPSTEAGPGGPWIAFVTNRAGTFDIYLVHVDGTGAHPLVADPGSDLYPSWSPDGTKIAYASNDTDSGAYQLFVVDVASGATQTVPTGLPLAVTPAWSPDGGTIALGGPNGLYLVPARGGTASPLTTGGFRDNTPAWSPDGSRLYFSSNRESGGGFDVWSVLVGDGGLAQVTSGTGILGGPAVSPDGKTLAVTESAPSSGAGGGSAVYFFAGDAGAPFTAMGDYEPAFSPDGTKLAVTSTRYDVSHPDVVLLGVPGATSPFRLTSGAGVSGQATFQPGR